MSERLQQSLRRHVLDRSDSKSETDQTLYATRPKMAKKMKKKKKKQKKPKADWSVVSDHKHQITLVH